MTDELKDIGFYEFLLWLLRLRRRFRVTKNSMLPRLKPGDEVLIDPGAYREASPRPGDIVVARHPYRTDVHLIKRVASVVEDGSCILEGDNPSEGTDSRIFGPVAPDLILGRVTSRF
jgi:nickel-type superoxide dismutase maturation protease